MKIGKAVLSSDDNWCTCTIPVTVTDPGVAVPAQLIYQFPVQYKTFLNLQEDAPAAALLPLAMALGESIECEQLSERLAYGLHEVSKLWANWAPKRFKTINIQAQTLTQMTQLPGKHVGCAFSGGVDSLRLLQSHLPPAQTRASLQVKYAVFGQGFDIPLTADDDFNGWCRIFEQSLAPLGVTLVPVRTNLSAFTAGLIPWRYAHGAGIISVALLLQGLFKQFLLASNCILTNIQPYGSSIALDHWFSTENMAVRYVGIQENRRVKTSAIAHWQPAQSMLRVCIDLARRRPGINCGRCSKCKRTLSQLHLMGPLDPFTTFPGGFPLKERLSWVPDYGEYYWQILAEAWAAKKALALPLLLLNGLYYYTAVLLRLLTPPFLFRWLKQKLFPPHKNPFLTQNLPPEWR